MNWYRESSYILYIVLIWLPLANLNETIQNERLESEENKLEIKQVEKEKEKVVEIVEKKKENEGKNDFSNQSRASEFPPNENSANFRSKIKCCEEGESTNDESAQNLSALNVNMKNNASAQIYDKRKRSRRKRKALETDSKRGRTEFNDDDEDDVIDKDPNDLDDDDEDLDNDDVDEEANSTELGAYLGAHCEFTCSAKLLHVFCDPGSQICECEKKYPVPIGIGKGCAKPKQLGDQCFYAQTCSFYEPNAICMQIDHNAICQCKPGFHTVALQKGSRKTFCSEDLVVLTADLPTLLGVATGIAILTGLICFVLKLFSSNRYPHPRHYANANLAPPLLFSSDNQWINGIPLTVHGRPASRSSSQRSTTNLAHYSRQKGVLVPASRAGAARAAAILLIPCHLQASRTPDQDVVKNGNKEDSDDVQENELDQSSHPGSRRPSISSIHSTASSQRSMSYSARRFEQENQQREQRAAMRAAREEAARAAAPPTPSPMSTDELLPSCSKIEDDPLGFSCSVLSVRSAASPLATTPKETSIPEFSPKLSP